MTLTAERPSKSRGKHLAYKALSQDLTPQEEAFLATYLRTFKGAEAAREIGVPEKSAKQFAWKTLQKPAVQERLARYRARLIERMDLNAERIIQELGLQAFFDPRQFFETRTEGKGKKKHTISFAKRPDQLTDDQARMVRQVRVDQDGTVQYQFVDRQFAIDRLARNLGVIAGSQGIGPTLPALPGPGSTSALGSLPFDLRKLSDQTLHLLVEAFMLAKDEAERAPPILEGEATEDVPDVHE